VPEALSRAAAKTPDRRLDVRYVGPVPGCYTFSDRKDPADELQVYACRTQSVSAAAIAMTAPVTGEVGERLTARFDGLGIVRGYVERQTADGFVFKITASDQNRIKLAAKILWLKQKHARQQSDKREHRRFQPIDPRSILGLGDGAVTKCFVIDLSSGGAAISASFKPEVGTKLVLGRVSAHVVRHLEVGFAVEFDAPQDVAGVEQLTTGFAPVWPPTSR
jgi:hypothetical protein